MKLSRRAFLHNTVAIAGLGAAMTVMQPFSIAFAASKEELEKPSALGDFIIGSEDAPNTVIEYSSLTCSHCAHYKVNTYPELKEKYIDTGKVRYIYREFPLDMIAAAASMLGRSLPRDRYENYLATMSKHQRDWAFTDDPYGSLLKMAQQMGITEEQFKKAISDDAVLQGLDSERQRAISQFNIDSTPTFFINGEMHKGALTIEDFEEIFNEQN